MVLLLYLETYPKRNSRVPSEAESLSQAQKRRRPFILQFAPSETTIFILDIWTRF